MVVTRSYPMEGRVTAVEERMVKLEQKLGVIVEEQSVMRSGFDRLDLKMAALFKALQIPFPIDETPARRENQLLEEGDVEAPISKESGKDPRKMETHEIPAYPTSPSTGDVNMQDSKLEVPAAENGVSESADQSQMETYAKAEASKKIAPVSEVIYGALAASDLQNIPTQSIKASVGSLDCTIEINSMAGIRRILEVTYERQGGYQLKPPWPWIATTTSSIKFDPLENLEADFLAMKNIGGKFLVFQSALPSTGIGARSAREIEGRVGGGIYTKAVDVGDDLIGKIERNIPEDCSTVNTLLEYNASYSAEDKEGMTPLNLLSQGPGNQKLRDLLLQHLEEQRKQKAIDACSETKAKMDALHMFLSRLVQEVHAMVLKSGDDLNESVENAILDAYSKCGSLGEVNKIFNRMRCRDVVSWTTLATGYSQCSKWDEALIIFFRMREEWFIPNSFTLSTVLTACGNLCYLECGSQIHGLSCKLGFHTVRFVESALVDMYAKGGCINEAEKVFNQISNPDVVSLTAMLSAYAYHGCVAHALGQFKRMEEMHIKPNAVTFLCVLFACSHAGLVEEGLLYFWSMEKHYGLVPTMEHYACIVDLLGRVGRLDEALEFIIKMPVEPDEMVWQSLLAACRTHGSVEFGEIAAKKILSLRPDYSSTYVLLANTYMETGSMRDGVDLRKVMKEKGVRKEAGYSWISVKGRSIDFMQEILIILKRTLCMPSYKSLHIM